MKIQIIGLSWYYKEDFENIKKIFTDGEKIGKSYEDWLLNAENTYNQLISIGVNVEKVYINSEYFLHWCEQNKFEINSQARQRFVNEIAFKKYLENQQFEALYPIFIKYNLKGSLKQIGTGVLVDISGRVFLLTAAHVINQNKFGDILIPTNEGLKQLPGEFSFLDLYENKKGSEIIYDVGYFKLDVNFSEKYLSTASKIRIEDLAFIKDSTQAAFYTIAGYPSSKSKVKSRLTTSEAYFYGGCSVSKEVYSEHGFDPHLHIIVKFRRELSVTTEGVKTFPPFFRGLSGGGIFIWPNDFQGQLFPPIRRLVGIFHRYYKNDKLLIGTNIQILIKCIAKNNPDLNIKL